MIRVTVAGVDRAVRLGTLEVEKAYNERWRARCTFEPGYIPTSRQEIIVYEADGTTPLFGGIIHDVDVDREGASGEGPLHASIEAVDWWAYLDWILVNGGYGSATVSLEQVLTDLVDNYLAAYGITLDAAQETGPTGSSPGLNWAYKWAAQVIRDLSTLSGGWVASLSTAKVLRMVKPSLATPSAPYALTDGASHCIALSWRVSNEKYANRVTLRCGGNKTEEVTKSWTVTSQDVTNGYVDTDVPATPTGGVSATIDRGGGPVAVSIGASGSELIWTWDGGANGTARVTPGTISPAIDVGDVLAVTYTGQYPFTVVRPETPPATIYDAYYEFDEITDLPAAEDMATGLLAKHNQDPKLLSIVTLDAGFEPGQVLTVNLTTYGINTTALITNVRASVNNEGVWEYVLEAIDGTWQGSPLDFLRGLTGRSSGASAATYSPGISTGGTAVGIIPLGGDTARAVTPASGTYVRVVNAFPFVAPADAAAAIVRVELWARSGGVQVTAVLYDLDAAGPTGTSSGVTATTPTLTSFTASLVAGHRYELRITSNSSGADIYGIGTLQVL